MSRLISRYGVARYVRQPYLSTNSNPSGVLPSPRYTHPESASMQRLEKEAVAQLHKGFPSDTVSACWAVALIRPRSVALAVPLAGGAPSGRDDSLPWGHRTSGDRCSLGTAHRGRELRGLAMPSSGDVGLSRCHTEYVLENDEHRLVTVAEGLVRSLPDTDTYPVTSAAMDTQGNLHAGANVFHLTRRPCAALVAIASAAPAIAGPLSIAW